MYNASFLLSAQQMHHVGSNANYRDIFLLADSCQNFTRAVSHDGRQRIVHCHCNMLQVGGPRILVQRIAVYRLLLVTFKGDPGNVCLPLARRLVTTNNYTVHCMSQFKLKQADMTWPATLTCTQTPGFQIQFCMHY